MILPALIVFKHWNVPRKVPVCVCRTGCGYRLLVFLPYSLNSVMVKKIARYNDLENRGHLSLFVQYGGRIMINVVCIDEKGFESQWAEYIGHCSKDGEGEYTARELT